MISPLMDLDYENMSKLIYQHKTGEVYKGLRTIGVQRDYSSPDIYMFVNDGLASEVKTFLPTVNLGEYVIANPSRELVFTALEKYRRRNFSFDVKSEYSGYKFKDWLFSMLDNFYNVDQGYKIVVRDIESFSLDDLSLQSRKASPGFLTNRNGVRNKADKLDFTKAWAKTYRRSILTQLSYLKEVDVHGELKTLYSKYKKKLSNLKQLQVYPVYQTGEPIGDIVVSNEVMGLI